MKLGELFQYPFITNIAFYVSNVDIRKNIMNLLTHRSKLFERRWSKSQVARMILGHV